MMTVTLKFQSSGMVPGDGRPVQMKGGSLTVGRGPGNDLVLPDPDRMLSKSHFVIEDHNGKVVIVDDLLATGGTVEACLRLVEKTQAEIIGCCFLIELDFLGGREKLSSYDVFSLIRYEG